MSFRRVFEKVKSVKMIVKNCNICVSEAKASSEVNAAASERILRKEEKDSGRNEAASVSHQANGLHVLNMDFSSIYSRGGNWTLFHIQNHNQIKLFRKTVNGNES